MSTDERGRQHTPAGTSHGGQYATERRSEPAVDTLTRVLTPNRLTISHELGAAVKHLEDVATGVQTRESLQTALTRLRQLRPDLGKVEIVDSFDDTMTFGYAETTNGEDITETDWYNDGIRVHIADLAESIEEYDSFSLTRRHADTAEHLQGMATKADSGLSWNVDVDEALNADTNDTTAIRPEQRLHALTWASRELEAALEKVRVSEGHIILDEFEKTMSGLPDRVKAVSITHFERYDGSPERQIKLLDASGVSVWHEFDAYGAPVWQPADKNALTLAQIESAIPCPLSALADRGTYTGSVTYDEGVLVLEVTR